MKCNLKEILKRKGFTQRYVAACLGVSLGAFSQWIKFSRVPHKRLDDLCGLLNVTLDELFTVEPTEWVDVEEVA